jgi:glycosyltransferase involved in cell wall biosynthesis
LLIVGDGSGKADCQTLVSRLGAEGVHFLPCLDLHDAPSIQSMADVLLLPVKRGAAMSSVPSKLIAYMLSAKPVLATVDAESDTARYIREANCGWVGKPENLEWLAGKMVETAGKSRTELDAHGERGRLYALRHFSRQNGVERLATIVANAVTTARQLLSV